MVFMNRILKLSLICSVLLAAAAVARPQAEDRLAAEKEEVIKLAKKFSERYEQTKSLEPLIGEFFTPSFARNIRKSQFFRLVVHFAHYDEYKPLRFERINRQLLRRFYVGYTDAIALSFTWGMQFGCEENGDNWKLRCDYPEDAKDLLRQNPLWASVVGNVDGVKDISSARDLLRVTKNLEQVNAAYRVHLRSFPQNKTPQYLKELDRFEVEADDFFEPVFDDCDDDTDCLGRPSGSRIYRVAIPPGQWIFIAMVNGRLRVLEIFPYMA